MVSIPQSHHDILAKRALAHFATVDGDGAPHVTPVWFRYDGAYILVNSARGRKKDRNLSKRPLVALSILDPDDPTRYIGIQGRVVEITEEGAEALINELALKYWGREYTYAPGQVRVTYRIAPERVWVHG